MMGNACLNKALLRARVNGEDYGELLRNSVDGGNEFAEFFRGIDI